MNYKTELFSHTRPNSGVTVAPFIYQNGKIKVLLYKRGEDAAVFNGMYSLPNRFFDITEFTTLNEAANYALEEKTNISIPQITQFHTFSGNHIDPERIVTINTAFYSILNEKDVAECKGEQPFETEWIDIELALKLELSFNHNEVLEMAFQKVKAAAEYTTAPIHFLEDKFTINDLKELTALLIGQELDNSRFRSRIKKSGILIECEGEKSKKGSFRPSQLYIYNVNYSGYFYPRSLTSTQ